MKFSKLKEKCTFVACIFFPILALAFIVVGSAIYFPWVAALSFIGLSLSASALIWVQCALTALACLAIVFLLPKRTRDFLASNMRNYIAITRVPFLLIKACTSIVYFPMMIINFFMWFNGSISADSVISVISIGSYEDDRISYGDRFLSKLDKFRAFFDGIFGFEMQIIDISRISNNLFGCFLIGFLPYLSGYSYAVIVILLPYIAFPPMLLPICITIAFVVIILPILIKLLSPDQIYGGFAWIQLYAYSLSNIGSAMFLVSVFLANCTNIVILFAMLLITPFLRRMLILQSVDRQSVLATVTANMNHIGVISGTVNERIGRYIANNEIFHERNKKKLEEDIKKCLDDIIEDYSVRVRIFPFAADSREKVMCLFFSLLLITKIPESKVMKVKVAQYESRVSSDFVDNIDEHICCLDVYSVLYECYVDTSCQDGIFLALRENSEYMKALIERGLWDSGQEFLDSYDKYFGENCNTYLQHDSRDRHLLNFYEEQYSSIFDIFHLQTATDAESALVQSP